MIYFDHASTTPLLKEVKDFIKNKLNQNIGNPSSQHAYGRRQKAEIEEARYSIAKMLGAEPREIYFTSGGTESNNIIIQNAKSLGFETIITSKLEHSAVFDSCLKSGLDIKYVVNTDRGMLNLGHLKELLQKEKGKVLVSLMHANNEIGNINDILTIGRICQKYGAFFHTDAVQTVGKISINLKELPVNAMSGSFHKIGGTVGSGFLYLKKDSNWKALVYGGGQERGLRAGTESVLNITSGALALELSLKNRNRLYRHTKSLKYQLVRSLYENIDGIGTYGQSSDLIQSLSNILSIKLPKSDPQIYFNLDMNGFAVSAGSACQSGAQKTSRVISEIDKNPTTPIRVSFSLENTKDEVDKFVMALKEFC